MSVTPDDGGLGRREFCVLVAGALVLPAAARPEVSPMGGGHGGPGGRKERVALYASTGPLLTRYRVDRDALTLRRAEEVTLPAAVQYAWRHPARSLLYVAYSDRAGSDLGTVHGVATLRIDERGRLHRAGPLRALPSRPIHITVDATGTWLLVAYNSPSAVTVHEIGADGVPGDALPQPGSVDAGVYAHQVRVTPSNRTVVLSARGNDPTPTTPEDPGALKVFDLVDGQLLDTRSIAPDGGFGFGPRHVDFHPRAPWMYVSDERANELHAFRLRDDVPAPTPAYSVGTLESPGAPAPVQVAGAVHVSADGRHVYLANRADATTEQAGEQVFAGGENSIAVFRVDRRTGEPVRIQNAATRSFHVRTFTLHPEGRMLVAASVAPMLVRERRRLRTVPARLTVFRVRHDGRLDLARTYDVDTDAGTQFWTGFVPY